MINIKVLNLLNIHWRWNIEAKTLNRRWNKNYEFRRLISELGKTICYRFFFCLNYLLRLFALTSSLTDANEWHEDRKKYWKLLIKFDLKLDLISNSFSFFDYKNYVRQYLNPISQQPLSIFKEITTSLWWIVWDKDVFTRTKLH